MREGAATHAPLPGLHSPRCANIHLHVPPPPPPSLSSLPRPPSAPPHAPAACALIGNTIADVQFASPAARALLEERCKGAPGLEQLLAGMAEAEPPPVANMTAAERQAALLPHLCQVGVCAGVWGGVVRCLTQLVSCRAPGRACARRAMPCRAACPCAPSAGASLRLLPPAQVVLGPYMGASNDYIRRAVEVAIWKLNEW